MKSKSDARKGVEGGGGPRTAKLRIWHPKLQIDKIVIGPLDTYDRSTAGGEGHCHHHRRRRRGASDTMLIHQCSIGFVSVPIKTIH